MIAKNARRSSGAVLFTDKAAWQARYIQKQAAKKVATDAIEKGQQISQLQSQVDQLTAAVNALLENQPKKKK